MEREFMPVAALFVGAGPANLAAAIRLADRIAEHNEAIENGAEGEAIDLEETPILVLEKGSRVGAHQLSGAILDPKALDELIPDWRERSDFPLRSWVKQDEMHFLTRGGNIKAPWVPKEMNNTGKPVIALGEFCAWLGEIAEEKGVMIMPEFAGASLLYDGDKVIGVRTGDKGVGPDGSPMDNFEPGQDIFAPVTVLGEGPRGSLTKTLIAKRSLDANSNPMVYEFGTKEIIEAPEGQIPDGLCLHGLGFPLDLKTFGGWFLYHIGGNQACIGMLVGADAADPNTDAHELLQRLKTHPYIKGILGGGKVVKYGAKAVTIGGWASMPQLYTDGAMIVGDSASFLNPMRVKGIHLSMKSGLCAAETAFAAIKGAGNIAERCAAVWEGEPMVPFTEAELSGYKQRVDDSWIRTEMEVSKNFHKAFENGLIPGFAKFGLQYLFGSGSTIQPFQADYTHVAKIKDYYKNGNQIPEKLEYDGTYIVDKLTDVYLSGTKHDEHQPAHLHIADREVCATKCKEEYGNPCTKFCPAQVYNMVENETSGRLEMQVDFSNCVHCKTCDIRDPYQIITWVTPQGGEGPEYHGM